MIASTALKAGVAGLLGALALTATAQADSISFLRGGDIWVASPDGTKQVQITHDGTYAYQSQADNGDFIALTGRRLRLIGRDGTIKADFDTPVSGVRTDPSASYFTGPYKPEISPNGQIVAYEYRYFEVTLKPGCVPTTEPRCQDVKQRTGIGYSHSNRQTGWDEPGLGRQSGWVDPSWIGNDTVLLSDKSVLPNLDAMIDHPGDGNQVIGNWFEDTNVWYVKDGEVARSGDKAAFVTTRPKGVNEDLDMDDQVTIYKLNGAPPALPTPCYSYGLPAGTYKSPSFSPTGDKIAFEDSATPGFAFIKVASVPAMNDACHLPSAGASQILDNARQPDWGPAGVPVAPDVHKPIVTTGAASAVTATAAQVAGTVDPEGASTVYRFEYGPTTAYGSTSPDQNAGSGRDPVAASATLSGLTSNTTYHYRLVAENDAGITQGPDRTLTTTAAAKPTVTTGAASAITPSAARLNATSNPLGTPTVVYFQYGASGFGQRTPNVDAGAGVSDATATFDLTGLKPNMTYHLRAVAVSAAGTTVGVDRPFTTLPAVKPAATVAPATTIGRTYATLNGAVNPAGSPTTYRLEYGLTRNYGTRTATVTAGAGMAAVNVSKAIDGLTAGKLYHYRVVATNAAGAVASADQTFTTAPPPPPPTAVTGTADYVTSSYAQLHGTVNPQGTPTTYRFVYGPTKNYGSATPDLTAGTGTTAINRSADVNGLQANTLYHYAIVAVSSAGTKVGVDRTFRTAELPGPRATTLAAVSVGRTTATLVAKIDPRGEFTNHHFEWGPTTSYGRATEDGFLLGGTVTTVKTALTGLQPGRTYHYRIVAEGETATATGVDVTFTTAP